MNGEKSEGPEELTVAQCIELAELARWAGEGRARDEAARAVLYLIGEALRQAKVMPETVRMIDPDD